MVDPLSTRDLIKKLGSFLADLTVDRPPARIHAEILDRLRENWQEPDPQLARIYFDEKDFSSVWTAVRNGASLPLNSWDTVVLPVIVYYSSKEMLKPNLQTAIHLWGQARTALSNVLEAGEPEPIVPVYTAAPEPTLDTLALPSPRPIRPEPPVAPPRRAPGRRRRLLAAGLVSLLAALGAVAVVVYDNSKREPIAGTLPRPVPTEAPPSETGEPSASPSAEPSASALVPTISPSPMAPGVVGPAAPHSLTALGRSQTTVKIGWQPPANTGTGGLSHYRIFNGTAEVGSVAGTFFTATGLSPKTAYIFSVMAVNRAGASSPASGGLTVTTLAPATIGTDPGSPISYGTAFRVFGSGWPCTEPAQVRVTLRGMPIAKPLTDSAGNFSVDIEIVADLPAWKIPVIDAGEEVYIVLERDRPETIEVKLVSHPQCAATALAFANVTFS